jgi:hypothetical protein
LIARTNVGSSCCGCAHLVASRSVGGQITGHGSRSLLAAARVDPPVLVMMEHKPRHQRCHLG